LRGHCPLLIGIFQQFNQGIGKTLGFAGLVEIDGQLFTVGHLAKVRQVRADDGNTIAAGQMRHSAAASRRRIRHYGHGRALK